jgi:tryptophanyl-tRNA synthetase
MALRYLSGIQPSGDLHLGNSFGAIRKHVENQDGAFYFIANYHALTTVTDPDLLRRLTFDAAATYLALGLDPERATLFRQSDVPEVCELTWLLSIAAGKGLLERAHSYKDKVSRGIHPSMGLFIYPILMAADILAYDADVVPVGSDQVQHVEMCRDMAELFNHRFGREVFRLPRHELGTSVPVPGIDGQKMSKSYGNAIPIFATGKALKERVMAIKTDATPLEAPKDPDTCTVFALHRLASTAEESEALAARYRAGGFGYGHAKLELLARLEAFFADARARYRELHEQPARVEEALQLGASKARVVAREVTDRARAATGLA